MVVKHRPLVGKRRSCWTDLKQIAEDDYKPKVGKINIAAKQKRNLKAMYEDYDFPSKNETEWLGHVLGMEYSLKIKYCTKIFLDLSQLRTNISVAQNRHRRTTVVEQDKDIPLLRQWREKQHSFTKSKLLYINALNLKWKTYYVKIQLYWSSTFLVGITKTYFIV